MAGSGRERHARDEADDDYDQPQRREDQRYPGQPGPTGKQNSGTQADPYSFDRHRDAKRQDGYEDVRIDDAVERRLVLAVDAQAVCLCRHARSPELSLLTFGECTENVRVGLEATSHRTLGVTRRRSSTTASVTTEIKLAVSSRRELP